MRVAIVHCHFRSGGVTQVVQNHVAALAPAPGRDVDDCILMSSERRDALREETLARVRTITVGELDYDDLRDKTQADQVSPSLLGPVTQATASVRGHDLYVHLIQRLANCGYTRENCVIHWHNHSIGKNAAAPITIAHLAAAGWKLLLQIHDFAEDQRPENYLHLINELGVRRIETLDRLLFPISPNIQYACLTGGDADCLRKWGVPSQQVHVLPNSVRLPSQHLPTRSDAMQKVAGAFGIDPASRWVLYPVRGIRRKNVGEFLLLCGLLPEGFVGGLTLRPDTPLEAKSYDRWHALAKEIGSNVVFDAAHHEDVQFIDNLAAAHCILSTSVAEGFGMAFLEPWLAGRQVVARDLPTVTQDFQDANVKLPSLYTRVSIPGTTEFLSRAREAWRNAREAAWSMLPNSARPSDLDDDGQRLIQNDTIDFAMLTPELQCDVIRRANQDGAFCKDLKQLNAGTLAMMTCEDDAELIAANAKAIQSRYHEDVQRTELLEIYRSLHESQDIGDIDGSHSDRMIDLIDTAHPFYPCRTETEI